MRMWFGASGPMPTAGCVLLLLASTAAAQIASRDADRGAVEQLYRGKTINIYVGAAVGGGYDGYARLLARPPN
jgi:tripartite-type tricarboxylate transporter receptor subunit TctC